jgi:tRNA-dihydrouridine synthase 4
MILAKEFVRNQAARLSDFTTNASDRPLIAQFGAHSSIDFSRAAELVKPYTDGVDLNCGCPQSWAIQEGIGCRLMQQPQLVKEMVRAAKDRCGEDFCVSIKIRVHHDLRETVDFVKMVESSGVDYITIHGRRRSQRSSEPVNSEAIALVKSVAGVPIVANGDVFSLGDAERIVGITGVDGVMAARGLMENPALFAGFKKTPWGAVERFLHYNANYGPLPYQLALHHVGEMLRDMMTKKERAEMTRNSGSIVELLDWLDERVIVRRYGEAGFGKGVEMERISSRLEF